MCGYERGVLLLGLFPPKTQTEKTEGTPLPTISAGVPRIEKDPHGGDVVIVPVRPYAKDMDRCTRCGKPDERAHGDADAGHRTQP